MPGPEALKTLAGSSARTEGDGEARSISTAPDLGSHESLGSLSSGRDCFQNLTPSMAPGKCCAIWLSAGVLGESHLDSNHNSTTG